ncbi:16S ribosomal RNA methyltransferase KsgA/Dim1 family protein [Neorhodopirellula pilleata]|uniref:16S ribosomal RNA methyltransferase KsgA/Dim1 family protein n=2 Tax=Neorhodopirellula pilleata TaxID=2714738 RepID=A0A5C6AX82_9BACT|nr:16S ribosomal RNA methyltransferase KsgA/Dim1 family protein [Neorhodopirellula pilleata]
MLGQYIPLLYHYNMLQDEDRVNAFARAIERIVRPAMNVVELGGGTGILSSLAARRGAQVICVERNPQLFNIADQLIRRNGLQDSVTVVHADATRFVPEKPVGAVICEMLHVGLLRERQASVIAAFKRNHRRRFPKSPLPIFIPEATVLMIQLVEQSFNFAGYEAPVPMFQAPRSIQPRTIELSELIPYANFGYAHTIPQCFKFDEELTTRQDGYLNAVRLLTQNVLAIDEVNEEAITWANQHLVLPLQTPLEVASGQTVRVCFNYTEGSSVETFEESLRVSSNSSPFQTSN